MIQASQQMNTVFSVCLSFNKKEKTRARLKTGSVEQDKFMYRYNKFESWTKSNYDFLVIWLVYKNYTNRYDTYKLLNNLSKETAQQVQKQLEKVITYEKVFHEDIEHIKSKIITPNNIFRMLQKDEIGPFSAYYYLWAFYREGLLSRLQQRKLDQLATFVDYFPKIKNFVVTYENNHPVPK